MTTDPFNCGFEFSIANAIILSCATTELMFPYGAIATEEIKIGFDGLAKFTMSNFAPMLFAMYIRSTSESNVTISAEFVPVAPFEKLVSKFMFNSLV